MAKKPRWRVEAERQEAEQKRLHRYHRQVEREKKSPCSQCGHVLGEPWPDGSLCMYKRITRARKLVCNHCDGTLAPGKGMRFFVTMPAPFSNPDRPAGFTVINLDPEKRLADDLQVRFEDDSTARVLYRFY